MDSCNDLDVLYCAICEARKEFPDDTVIVKLRHCSSMSTGELDLSNLTFTSATCSILAEILKNDSSVRFLKLADVMLSEQHVKKFLDNLASNSFLKKLDLRGNNLSKLSCETLGNFVRSNHTITHLLLEWNNLGFCNQAFSSFMDALSTNTTLVHLDLRNNQIDHKGGKEIAKMIRFNTTLKKIDLRWNNLGVCGGRYICDALKSNCTIEQLEVGGNNISMDICDNIESKLMRINNNDCSNLPCNESFLTVDALNREISTIKRGNQQHIEDILKSCQNEKDLMLQTCLDDDNQIKLLQQTLNENHCALRTLRAKLDMSEANERMMTSQLEDKQKLVELARSECQELIRKSEVDLKQQKEIHDGVMNKMKVEFEDLQLSNANMSSKITDDERKIVNYQQDISLLKKTNNQLKCSHREELSSLEERLTSDKLKFTREMEERDSRRKEETDRKEKVAEDRIRECEEKVVKWKGEKCCLEEEVRDLRRKMREEKVSCEKEVESLRKNHKFEIDALKLELENRTKSHQNETTNLTKELSTSNAKLLQESTLKQSRDIEIAACKESLQSLQNQLQLVNAEHEREMSNVRNEMKKREIQTSDELNSVSGLRGDIASLRKEIDENNCKHRKQLDDKQQENEKLKAEIRRLECEAGERLEEDQRKMEALHQALMQFASFNKGKTPKSSKIKKRVETSDDSEILES